MADAWSMAQLLQLLPALEETAGLVGETGFAQGKAACFTDAQLASTCLGFKLIKNLTFL